MLKTKRLILRQFTLEDLEVLVKHRSDKTVMKYLGGIQKPKDVKKRLKDYSEFYEKNGYAFCAMIWRKTNEFIGVGGLQKSPSNRKSSNTGETEVGYTVEKRFWGKGIATECTLACLDFGFNTIGLKRIIALTHSENIASIRVLEKAGMKFEAETQNMNETWVQYVISKDEYIRD